MTSAVKNAEGFRGKVGAVAKSLKSVLGPALVAAAAAAGAFAIKMGADGVKAAMENERTASALAKTLENLGKAHEAAGVEQFIAQLESSTGIVDDDLRPALGRLLIATGDVDEAQQLLTKSLDVAVGTGKEFTGVVDAIAKAVQTRTAGQLSRYGVIMDDNTLKTEGFTGALNGALDSFRGLQQAEARTLQGQLQILRVEADNVKEAFGRGLLGALGDTAGGVGNISEALRELQPLFEEMGRQIGEAVIAAGEIARAFGEAGEAVGVEYNEQVADAAGYTLGLTGLLKTLAGVLSLFGGGAGEASESTRLLVEQTGDYRDAAARARRTNVDFTQGIEDLGDEAEEATEKISALAGWISRTQTIMAYEAAWDDLRETVKENGKNFDITTEKGRDNTAALIEAAQRTADYAATQETMASKISVANSGLGELKTFLDRTKVSPETRQQLLEPFQALIDDLREAGIDVTGLQLMLDGLNGKVVDVTIRLNETWGARAGGGDGYDWRNQARGGLVSGRGGPMSDMIPTMLSNGEFVVRAQAVNSFGPDFFAALNRGINPLAGMDAPRMSDRSSGPSRSMVIENINVTAASNEPAEVTVPRALRRLAWVSGLDG
jgi:tetratricopeptide (TPR) repeat protein